jgi:collagen type VII alpha
LRELPKDSFPNSSREIVFVDPTVVDIGTILRSLRPAIEAMLLDRIRPAARQIAAALADRRGLTAVHIIAHGAPGRVSFAAGEWSSETFKNEAADFTAIGDALATGGDLRLWSCLAGLGKAGEALIQGLAQATGAEVSAATGLIGAAALGGRWELEARLLPPSPGRR